MNNSSDRLPTPPFLIIAAILGAVMAFPVLTGAPPPTVAQQGYPAPAATTPPAYPGASDARCDPSACRHSAANACQPDDCRHGDQNAGDSNAYLTRSSDPDPAASADAHSADIAAARSGRRSHANEAGHAGVRTRSNHYAYRRCIAARAAADPLRCTDCRRRKRQRIRRFCAPADHRNGTGRRVSGNRAGARRRSNRSLIDMPGAADDPDARAPSVTITMYHR